MADQQVSLNQVESNLKRTQRKVLTVVEAAIGDPTQREAIVLLIKQVFNSSLNEARGVPVGDEIAA